MPPQRWAWVDVDLEAIRHNVALLRTTVAPSDVWVVVKANAYGHGALEVAQAALDAGAGGLCVALVQEGVELRRGGIDAPILVLSEQPPDAAPAIVANDLTPTVYTDGFIDALAVAALAAGRSDRPVHVKVDTGMQRVGAQPEAVAALVERIGDRSPTLRLGGVFTHLALADEPGDEFTALQVDRFDQVLSTIGVPDDAAIHAANSAGALAHPAARRSFVRAGIAVYGISPGHGVDHLCHNLRPALSLRARVSFVKTVRAGSRISYGLRHTFDRDTTVATVPIGYADGVPRRLSSTGGQVLIAGRRCPIVGAVTMDQLMVDCGPGDDAGGAPVAVGDEVVLIGSQDGPDGLQWIRAEDWADQLGTIGYEIVCGVGTRVPRRTGRSIDP
ncbi:MAG TPA: alanine racemase [Ilumatobacteraceae bacterium]|nr:alanine racemase [Ilumatobacteraceae bacterium]